MFDPMQAYRAGEIQLSAGYDDLDEEQRALRHGYVVRPASPRAAITVELGRLLIRAGERLTGECPHIEFTGKVYE